MSLYGLERRTNFSPFQFDKIYKSRKDMDDANSGIDEETGKTKSDGIYIGRYILISYGESQFDKAENGEVQESAEDWLYTTGATLNYNNDDNVITINQNPQRGQSFVELNPNEEFQANLLKDLNEYGNSYHNTVWMKVYRNAIEEYIMIAELNARAPQMKIETTNSAIKSFTNSNNGIVTDETEEVWQEPYFDFGKSTELLYTLQMPQTHRYKVSEPNFAVEGFNPEIQDPDLALEILNHDVKGYSELDPDNNYINWQYINKNNNPITSTPNVSNQVNNAYGKQLNINLPALGQIMSILYDVLLGSPSQGSVERPTGLDDIDWEKLIGGTGSEGFLKIIEELITETGILQIDWQKPQNISGSIINKPVIVFYPNGDSDQELGTTTGDSLNLSGNVQDLVLDEIRLFQN